MDEFLNMALPAKNDYQLLLATVGSASSSGVTLTFDGLGSPTQKHFKRLAAGPALAANDRVIVARMSGSYVVLGKIAWSFDGGGGSSVSPYNQNPASNGTASPGTSALYSRGDHVHPHDSAKADKAGTPIPANSDLNDYYTTGQYYINLDQAGTIANCPVPGTFLLTVETCGARLEANRFVQRLYAVSGTEPTVYERMKNGSFYTAWKRVGVPPVGSTQYFYIDGSSTTVGGETVYAGDDANTGLTSDDPLRTLDRAFYLSNGNDLRISFQNKYSYAGLMVYSTGKNYFSGMSIHFINDANTSVRINFTASSNIQFYNCYTHIDGVEFSWAAGKTLYFDGGFANHSGKTLNGTLYPVKFITNTVNYNGMAARCDDCEYHSLGVYESVARFQRIELTDTAGSVDGITMQDSVLYLIGNSTANNGLKYKEMGAGNANNLIKCTRGQLFLYMRLSAASGRACGLYAYATEVHSWASTLSDLASISGGNSITSAATVFRNSSPAYFGEHGEYGPCYVNGDTFSTANPVTLGGCTTNQGKTIYFSIPVDKSLERISTVTVQTCTGAVRGLMGLVGGSSANFDWLQQQGVTVTAKIATNHLVNLNITSTTAFSGIDTNNTALSARLSLAFSFS